MATEEVPKVETEAPTEVDPVQETKELPEEKTGIPTHPEEKTGIPDHPEVVEPVRAPPPEEKHDDSKALVAVKEAPEAIEEKAGEGSINRDAVLSRVATEKRMSLVRAWEESEKSKAENKAQKKASAIAAWENSKKATIEAELKKIEEKLEKQKAQYIEKMQNKVAMLHKKAEEKRAIIEAQRGEELLKAEETAAKYRATGTAPKKLLGYF